MNLQVIDTGIVCHLPGETHGYFAWPSLARQEDGTLWVAASGPRLRHVCPWGKSALFKSTDGGHTWSAPRVLNDTPLDDRDCGLISLGGQALLLSWFSSDIRRLPLPDLPQTFVDTSTWNRTFTLLDSATCQHWERSWVRVSEDGVGWSDFIPVPVSAPHGPVRLHHRFGQRGLLYLGKRYPAIPGEAQPIQAYLSADGGRSWQAGGVVPCGEAESHAHLWEPHAVELPGGKLLGLIRGQFADDPTREFHLYQTESADGGATWTPARPTGLYGSPPHLLLHESGALICTYGYRRPPFGIRARISRDQGATWGEEQVLRDDGLNHDLGYPATVALPGGQLLTVHYQQLAEGEPCALVRTHWRLPTDSAN